MKTKKQNILITGANGFVGRALTKKLLETGDNLFLVSRDKKFKVPGAKVFYGDLTDKKFVAKIISGIDTVYYLVAFHKNISVHTTEPFEAVSGNVLPLLHFLEAVKKSKIKNIIYTSSTIVEYIKDSEDKIDGYVFGKYINEQIIKSFTAQTKIPVKIVRSAALYGPGNDFNPKSANVIPSLIVKVAEAREKIALWGKGERKLQFLYIDDLISNLIAIAKSDENFFVVGNHEIIHIKDILNKIIRLMDKKLKISHDLSKPDKKTQLSQFKNLVKPKTSLNSGLRLTIDHYLKNHA